jgi:hypothetical protein
MKSSSGNVPPPVIRTANLNADLAATSEMLNIEKKRASGEQAARVKAAEGLTANGG